MENSSFLWLIYKLDYSTYNHIHCYIFYEVIDQLQQTKSSTIETHLEINLPLAFLILNRLARNINRHSTVHLHNHMLLHYIHHVHPSRNPRIATHCQQPRIHVRLQVWVGREHVRDDIHGNIHPHGPSGLCSAWRTSSLAHHCAVIIQRGGSVAVLERSHVRVLHRNIRR